MLSFNPSLTLTCIWISPSPSKFYVKVLGGRGCIIFLHNNVCSWQTKHLSDCWKSYRRNIFNHKLNKPHSWPNQLQTNINTCQLNERVPKISRYINMILLPGALDCLKCSTIGCPNEQYWDHNLLWFSFKLEFGLYDRDR